MLRRRGTPDKGPELPRPWLGFSGECIGQPYHQPMRLTEWLGVWGGVLSTALGVLQVIRWRQDRRDKQEEQRRRLPALSIEICASASQQIPVPHLMVRLVNSGEVPIYDPHLELSV